MVLWLLVANVCQAMLIFVRPLAESLALSSMWRECKTLEANVLVKF